MKKIFANIESLDLEIGKPLRGNDNLVMSRKSKRYNISLGKL